jgi:hypothetical protein
MALSKFVNAAVTLSCKSNLKNPRLRFLYPTIRKSASGHFYPLSGSLVFQEANLNHKILPNIALHPTRARKLFRVFKFRVGRGRVSLGVRRSKANGSGIGAGFSNRDRRFCPPGVAEGFSGFSHRFCFPVFRGYCLDLALGNYWFCDGLNDLVFAGDFWFYCGFAGFVSRRRLWASPLASRVRLLVCPGFAFGFPCFLGRFFALSARRFPRRFCSGIESLTGAPADRAPFGPFRFRGGCGGGFPLALREGARRLSLGVRHQESAK